MPDWDEILARDGPAAWRVAYRIVGNRADADECFQEAFLDAWEAARRGPVTHWAGFLKRVVAARAVDRLRRRARRQARESSAGWGDLRGAGDSPSKAAEDAELSTRLREALARLPPRQAGAFCLQVLEGWSYAEIAEHLGESTDAVGVMLHRARKALRALLGHPEAARRPTPRERAAGPPTSPEESP